MNLWITMLVTALVLMLTSCGGVKHFEANHVNYDDTKSKAMNIALLTGLTDVEKGPLKDGEPTGNSGDGGMGGAAVTNLAAGSFDLLSGGAGLGVMTSFLFKTYQPEWLNLVFAWMPKDMAEDEEKAAVLMCNMMYDTMSESLPDNAEVTKDSKCNSYQYAHIKYDLDNHHINFLSNVDEPFVVNGSADILGVGQSYYWSYQKTNSDTSPKIISLSLFEGENAYKTRDARSFEQVKVWSKMSPKLPFWVYFYIAPNRVTGEPAYFLNQGKKLYFVKPS